MNKELLQEDVQQFITENLHSDPDKVLFKKNPFPNLSIREIVVQIQSKQKIQQKLPTWFYTKQILYPPKLHMEQTSSEAAAAYKSSLFQGNTLADLTGGFGVDSFYFSKKFSKVLYFETNTKLFECAKHNFDILKATLLCYNEDGIAGIKNSYFDVIYIDPSRRTETKKKVYFLEDCLPNVAEHMDYLADRCHTLVIKTSPMLDITLGKKELRFAKEVHVIALENEVKELLWVIEKNHTSRFTIKTVNLKPAGTEFFDFQPETAITIPFSQPQNYLYEPNAAILKSGGFHEIAHQYSLSKLHAHTHLYTSEKCIKFPGRVFKIVEIVPYAKKELKQHIYKTKANVTIRNFPSTVEKIKKTCNIADGGDKYLFFTTLLGEKKAILVCEKN